MSNKNIKIALLSGAIKNAGDFLIVDRCKELLKSVYPDCIITSFDRLFKLDNQIDEINSHDILVFGGGPGYIPGLYPNHMPLVTNLSDIKIPIFVLGMGWFGNDAQVSTVYNYQLTGATLELFKRVQNDTQFLGCRDWYSVNVLRNSGIQGGYMTGCPAWYNIDFVDQLHFTKNIKSGIKKICISDPAKPYNAVLAVKLVKYLKKALPDVEMKFIFHRGIEEDKFTSKQAAECNMLLKEELERENCSYANIAFGMDGFKEYDDCDLHIGFRVHAHIYNLSRRNASILIEEDGRGAGVDNALGLDHLTAYELDLVSEKKDNKIINSIAHTQNRYFEYQIDDCLNNLWNSNFMKIENAFLLMNKYYQNMVEHIKSISDFI